ncbi:NADPH:quinone oxidoreductase family protein [Sphingorhabdus sp. 109]|jgi:NADPH2:quinone reductase|uniref:NADPH:quinone oxidoreductase family protein n=1 Tax=Sphingorhabdus sp. 109 TaxID=2653173 RepID=UPI0012F01E6B|nr:NADPH:quinone oxidoreductase family protein [Sphingorhabdus sp. 109]VWX57537.1 Phthiocerol synthesis polyketide synthase type I PpsC [Sphingorhabdus sp. 109]
MSDKYQAAVCTDLGGPSSIRILEQQAKPLRSGEIRILVHAAGLNFPDLLMTEGKYQFRPDPPFIPGMEAAGEVIEVASDVDIFKPGDRVMTGGKGGALAEQWVVRAAAASPLPDALSFSEGASWQAAGSTAWHALVERGHLRQGESVLVLGASGGVGMAAVKMAKHVGATVIGTGSSDEKRKTILAAGADHVLDPSAEDLAARVKALTDGKGVDLVYDPVGGDLALTATRAIAWNGRYLIIGFASGKIPAFPANHAMIKTYSLIGVRAGESPRRDPELARRQSAALQQLAAEGAMRPHISHRFALADTAEALRVLERREAIGRVVIEIIPGD